MKTEMNFDKILRPMKLSQLITLAYWNAFNKRKFIVFCELVEKGMAGRFAFENAKAYKKKIKHSLGE